MCLHTFAEFDWLHTAHKKRKRKQYKQFFILLLDINNPIKTNTKQVGKPYTFVQSQVHVKKKRLTTAASLKLILFA